VAQEKTTNKEWQPVLDYTLELHKKCIHLPIYSFDNEKKEIGVGYGCGAVFGYWDIVHQMMDVLVWNPEHGIK
jgi:hypothetical protein